MTDATAENGLRPLYLLADSELLFWKNDAGAFLASVLQSSGKPAPNVAYIGASNGDSSEAYSILTAALRRSGQDRAGCYSRTAPR